MDYALLSLVIFFAAILSTSIDFGFSLLAVPILIIFLPIQLAIAVNMLLALLVNLINLPRVWRYLDQQFTVKLFIGTFWGMIPGTLIYIYLDLYWLKILLCSIILMLTLMMIRGYTLSLPKRTAPYIVGVVSGTLGASVGLPGHLSFYT
jgi:hypothetical protein